MIFIRGGFKEVLSTDVTVPKPACEASISVRFQSKERLRNGIFGFGRKNNGTRTKE